MQMWTCESLHFIRPVWAYFQPNDPEVVGFGALFSSFDSCQTDCQQLGLLRKSLLAVYQIGDLLAAAAGSSCNMSSGSIIHWGPLFALAIIISLFVSGTYCTLIWFPPWSSTGGLVHFTVYVTWAVLIMNSFLKSAWLGPGFVPLKWKAVSPTMF